MQRTMPRAYVEKFIEEEKNELPLFESNAAINGDFVARNTKCLFRSSWWVFVHSNQDIF